jgi:transcriptional regulator with GAF, ATPase, and Fis domain
MTQHLVDLTSDLRDIATLAAHPTKVDDLLVRALDYLGEVIPYELAAVLELVDDELRVRCARGPLASEAVHRHAVALSTHPTLRRVLETRRARVMSDHLHADEDGDPYDGVLDLPHGHSCMVVPLHAGDRTLGMMSFDNRECGLYDANVVNLAAIYGQIIALALVAAEQAMLLDRYRAQLERLNAVLVEEVTGRTDAAALLDESTSPAMRTVVRMARQVAVTDVPVLVTGETGTGKEVVARAIHGWSRRHSAPFVTLNCATLPEQLIESELFGHRRGAFTGATADRTGRFAAANGGTLFLDEIGEMPVALQAKLLRVLQEGTFEPLGSDQTVKVDVRILAATNVQLETAIAEGRFREDLYYRLSVFPIELPPLRERMDDVPVIAASVLRAIAMRTGRGPWTLPSATIDRLRAHEWRGNIRELINVLERATILQQPGPLEVDLPQSGRRSAVMPALPERADASRVRTLVEVEREHIESVLARVGGKIYGTDGAAALLGLKPSTLQSRMQRLGLR